MGKPIVPREQANHDVDEALESYLKEASDEVALGVIDALEKAYTHISRKRSNNTVLAVRGNVTVAVLDIDMIKQMNRPRVAKACFFISLLLVLLLADSAICAADSTRQCPVPVGTKSFVFSSEGHTLRGFIEATAGGRNQPAILILHGSVSTDVMHDDRCVR